MLTFKASVVSVEIASSWLLATAADNTATRIALYAAAAAGLGWFWKNVLRPVAKVLHRMAAGVEALEELPTWRRLTDRRIQHLEVGLGHIGSGQQAILRELGIEDKVRRQYSDPEALEQLLADFEDDDTP